MFDLEKAIRNWRRSLQKKRRVREGDIAELESHLREEMDRQVASGLDEESAFRAALERSASIRRPGRRVREKSRRGGSAAPGAPNFLAGLFPVTSGSLCDGWSSTKAIP